MANTIDRLLPDVEYELDFLTLVSNLVDSVEEYGLDQTSQVLAFPKNHELSAYKVTLSVERKGGPKRAIKSS